jgi:putative phosphoesterase
MKIGVLSDTHGLLRPEVLPALTGVEHILHAGDAGNSDILDALRALAPVTAVRGNIDTHGPCAELPATQAIELGGCFIYMLHSIDDLDIKPQPAASGWWSMDTRTGRPQRSATVSSTSTQAAPVHDGFRCR